MLCSITQCVHDTGRFPTGCSVALPNQYNNYHNNNNQNVHQPGLGAFGASLILPGRLVLIGLTVAGNKQKVNAR